MFFWHWIIVQWIERNRIYFAVLRMGKPTNFSQFKFALFRSFWYIFPHRHGCYAFSKYNSLFSTQNHNQPATTLNWAKLDTFQACEICLFSLQLFDWNAAPKTCTRSPVQTHFLIFFFLQKSKGKRTPSHPNGLSCAHAQGCHVTHSSGRRTTGLKIAPNFTSGCGIGWCSCRPFLSSENAIHLYLHIFTIHFCILYYFFHVCDLRKPILEHIETIEVYYKTTN